MRHPAFTIVSAALCFMLSACATPSADPHTTAYTVSAVTTPFYKYGPAQAFGADETLSNGAHLTMLKREFGYSHVMLDNGLSGYVATDDLKAAPPLLAMTKGQPKLASGLFPRRKQTLGGGSKPQPLPAFDLRDVPPPPLPSNPEPAQSQQPESKPPFRF